MEAVAVLVGLGGLLLLAVVVVGGLYVSRQSTLSRRVGSFTCSLGGEREAWTAGTAQYCAGRLIWWRTLSLAPRPARTWSQTELVVVGRTALDERDEAGRELVKVACRHRGDEFDLKMSVPALAGLVSWLESVPRPTPRPH